MSFFKGMFDKPEHEDPDFWSRPSYMPQFFLIVGVAFAILLVAMCVGLPLLNIILQAIFHR